MRTVVVIRVIVLLQVTASSVFMSQIPACTKAEWKDEWELLAVVLASAQFWNVYRASHTWMDSLTLRLCVCLISFLNWGPVYGAFAGMNKTRQLTSLSLPWNLSFRHWSPVRRKCFMWFFREGRRGSSVLLQSLRRQALSFALAVAVLGCSCITDQERSPRVWWQNESWVQTHKCCSSCCESTCCTFSGRQFLAWG